MNKFLQFAPTAKSIGTYLKILEYINIFVKVKFKFVTSQHTSKNERMLHESKIPTKYNKIKICE